MGRQERGQAGAQAAGRSRAHRQLGVDRLADDRQQPELGVAIHLMVQWNVMSGQVSPQRQRRRECAQPRRMRRTPGGRRSTCAGPGQRTRTGERQHAGQRAVRRRSPLTPRASLRSARRSRSARPPGPPSPSSLPARRVAGRAPAQPTASAATAGPSSAPPARALQENHVNAIFQRLVPYFLNSQP